MNTFPLRPVLLAAVLAFAPFAASVADVSDADKEFMTRAAHSGQLEIQASALAEHSASSEKVKSFARRMVEDHGKAEKELHSLAEQKGVSLPDGLTEEQQKQINELTGQKGEEFDSTYAAQIGVKAHNEAVSLFEEASKHAKDDDVKAFAEKTLPVLKEHQKMANKLHEDIEQAKK